MASRILYGTCETARDTSVKIVEINVEEVGSFNRGDLLVVYFVEGNTADNPTLIVHNNTTDVQESISSDTGYFIKNELGINSDSDIDLTVNPIWKDKETVIFCYTENSTITAENTEAYYWCIIEGGVATLQEYGVTTLFDTDTNANFITWLKEPTITEDDKKKALAPATLKRLYQALSGSMTYEDTPDTISWIKYEPLITSEGSQDNLGKLILGIGEDPESILSEVTITAPLRSMIAAAAQNIQYTGQLINNGETGGAAPLIEGEETRKYITSYPPRGLYFGYDDTRSGSRTLFSRVNNSTKAYIVLGDDYGRLMLGNSSAESIVQGSLLTLRYGETLYIERNNNGVIQTKVTIDGNGIVYAPSFSEDGTLLKNKYEQKLTVYEITSNEIVINANTWESGDILSVNRSGYTPLGVVGFNVSNWSDDYSGCNNCIPYAIFYKNNRIRYNIRNISSVQRHIKLIVHVLYRKN